MRVAGGLLEAVTATVTHRAHTRYRYRYATRLSRSRSELFLLLQLSQRHPRQQPMANPTSTAALSRPGGTRIGPIRNPDLCSTQKEAIKSRYIKNNNGFFDIINPRRPFDHAEAEVGKINIGRLGLFGLLS